MTLIYAGLGLYLLGSLFGLGFLTLISFAAYCVAIFRMLSRNLEKRSMENRRYTNWKSNAGRKGKQSRARFRNRKQFKYFRCPGCGGWLKLPRGAGMVTVTCGRCQNSFTEKG